MQQINWQKILKATILVGILIIIITLVSYYYQNQNQIKITKTQQKTSPTSTVPGFPPGFTLEELKKIKVPEKGEKIQEGVAIPLETVPSAPQSSSKIRIFELKGEKNKLYPKSFIAYQNDILNIKLTAVDKDYDFHLEGYNLEIKAAQGETKTFEFQALNVGKYYFYCSLCETKEKPSGEIIIVPK